MKFFFCEQHLFSDEMMQSLHHLSDDASACRTERKEIISLWHLSPEINGQRESYFLHHSCQREITRTWDQVSSRSGKRNYKLSINLKRNRV
ncbi:hypothetical protein CEXT_131951 [Caerostris extrusa]|uniref:Uncharacterized protein n=1 Tax=Caerostris extrusa TaxID=172846 RepID=A0AAV4QV30_CAEEX|nr:hypothetical protein CEXT_131951 [Caerostris extrusa]